MTRIGTLTDSNDVLLEGSDGLPVSFPVLGLGPFLKDAPLPTLVLGCVATTSEFWHGPARILTGAPVRHGCCRKVLGS